MSSYRRNISRANFLQRPRALGAAVALALMSSSALANGAHRFVFTAYTNAAGGAQVVAGRYHAALARLNGQPVTMESDAAAINTNLCVAYSMTLQLSAARAACDAAVQAAKQQRALPTAWWSGGHPSPDDSQAVAYANRAVMYWLLHDEQAARSDLLRAQALSPQSAFVAQNAAALKAHTRMVAQAGTPAREADR
jgi:hypothetical protein